MQLRDFLIFIKFLATGLDNNAALPSPTEGVRTVRQIIRMRHSAFIVPEVAWMRLHGRLSARRIDQ